MKRWLPVVVVTLFGLCGLQSANAQQLGDYEFPVAEVGVLDVSVTDAGGKPINGAEVAVMVPEASSFRPLSKNTNDQGRASFRDLNVGTYHVAVRCEPWYEREVYFIKIKPRQGVHALPVALFGKGERPKAPPVVSNSCVICHQQRN